MRAKSPTTLQPKPLNFNSKGLSIRPMHLLKDVHCRCRCSYLQPLWLFPQMDHDPKNPSYIATQGPLAHTVSDFWQVSILGLLCHFLSRLVIGRGDSNNNVQASCCLFSVWLVCDHILMRLVRLEDVTYCDLAFTWPTEGINPKCQGCSLKNIVTEAMLFV